MAGPLRSAAWALLTAALASSALLGDALDAVTSTYALASVLAAAAVLAAAGAALGESPAPRREFLLPAALLAAALGCAFLKAVEPSAGRLVLIQRGAGLGVALVLAVWASPGHAARASASVLASGAALALYALYQRGWGLEFLERACRENPALAGLGTDTPEYARQMILSRLASREPYGSFAISNTLAGLMLLVSPLAAGAAADRWREGRRGAAGILFGLALGAGGVVALTGSKGAWVAAGILAAMWAWRRSRALRLLSLAGLAVGALAWASRERNGLEGSLSFRLGYWTGAARMILDHPWGGVGLGGFSAEYNRARPVWGRDVAAAHSEPLQLWAEGGIWVLAASLWFAGLCASRGRSAAARPALPGGVAPWIALAGAGFLLLLLPPSSLLPLSFFASNPWLRGFMAFAMAGIASGVLWAAWGGWGGGARRGALAGVLAVALHSLGDFDLSVPGVAWGWWAVLGALGAQATDGAGTRRVGWKGLAGLLALLAGTAAFVSGWAVPALEAERDLSAGGWERLRRAAEVDPGRAEIWAALGEAEERRWRGGEGSGSLNASLQARERAARLAPGNRRVRWDLALLYLDCAAWDPRCAPLALEWADHAVKAFPTAPLGHVQAAGIRRAVLDRPGLVPAGDRERLEREADEAYATALALDPEVRQENLKLTDAQRAEIAAWQARRP